jgi:demethylmenaquinone methyltransferase/2-methoxy-6-polyprenyl-1,4-benzoquinol methylase
MKDPRKIRSMFATVSRRYDLLNHLLSLNRDKSWRKKAVAMSGLGGGETVLDVCSGTADLALEYAGGVGPEGLVIGTDFCPEMLVIGKAKVAASGAKIDLMVADTIGLPFADNKFDVVSVAFGIRNVPDYEAGIREMARVAKSGGRVVILEFSMPEGALFRTIYRTYFTRALPLIGRVISRNGNDAYNYLPDSVLKFPSGAAMCKVMEGCGLADVSATRLTLGIVTLYIGRKR